MNGLAAKALVSFKRLASPSRTGSDPSVKRPCIRSVAADKSQVLNSVRSPETPNPHALGPTAQAAVPAIASRNAHPSFPPSNSDWSTTEVDGTRAVSPTPKYGPGRITISQEQFDSPGGRTHLILGEQKAIISQVELGRGGENIVYKASFESPGGSRYPAAAIWRIYDPGNVVVGQEELFGHLGTIRAADRSFVSLTRRGVTLDNAYKILFHHTAPPATKVAFLVKYITLSMDSLLALEAADRCHQDTKPENMIVFERNRATMIDLATAPKIDDLRFGSTQKYRSPNKIIRRASPLSDVFAIGTMLSNDTFTALQDAINRFQRCELAQIIKTLKSHNSIRPSLREAKEMLTTCLNRYLDSNPQNREHLNKLEEWFFSKGAPEIAVQKKGSRILR